jgi:hypothetical protein
MWRLDTDNGFIQLARSGLPRMHETQIDAKKELDNVLKSACFSLKHSAVKVLLGNIDAFLAKVTAFVGEIPISTEGSAADPAAAARGELCCATRAMRAEWRRAESLCSSWSCQ